MKSIAVSIFLAATLVFAASAFASVPTDTQMNQKALQQWIGKPAAQLAKTFGKPDYTSKTAGGRLVYDFIQEPQHVGGIPTYQFIINHNGKVVAATLTF